ncbi:hypothetical protein AUJ65_03275 [Candidatus Micrarchaeota archaeon CG1_02_51_15]|nr:MAG: hypothetical protein AUJ65_03275 [Candidatus Micrarchaeota archaeon CG1_02_51_15]
MPKQKDVFAEPCRALFRPYNGLPLFRFQFKATRRCCWFFASSASHWLLAYRAQHGTFEVLHVHRHDSAVEVVEMVVAEATYNLEATV